MALKKKKSVKEKNGKNSSNKNYFILTSENKKQILGIFLLITSVILFLSVITFDRRDEANLSNSYISDFFKSFDTKIDIQNWLGVTGAHFSLFLVKATFGYFSISIPLVLFLWGISFFKKIDFKFRLHVSNFLLLSSIILASFFGVLQVNYGLFSSTYELSGFIGNHLGNFLSGLVGGIGSILILTGSF
ncbi:MAG TPA: DNA translocase FtsK 4TM domain-containing protein, partial [Ignavibacteriaceae bacterium]